MEIGKAWAGLHLEGWLSFKSEARAVPVNYASMQGELERERSERKSSADRKRAVEARKEREKWVDGERRKQRREVLGIGLLEFVGKFEFYNLYQSP
ncbi:hypothetical protein V5O48_013140 [Marasmius crinis-equi]|uniref:Uncharacterized protein n=1 Tax=Marasmius crinis-equi TaxID=585013 RepID=A0ABR3F118_9AGAR